MDTLEKNSFVFSLSLIVKPLSAPFANFLLPSLFIVYKLIYSGKLTEKEAKL